MPEVLDTDNFKRMPEVLDTDNFKEIQIVSMYNMVSLSDKKLWLLEIV
jgi:hypothetical protein